MADLRIVIPENMVKEIAGLLDAGMICFYHLKTGELEYYPDPDKHPGFDEEVWEETIDKVEDDADYVRFEGMETHESFEIIEDFINEIAEKKIQQRFEEVIQHRKPFQQFKNLLLHYPDLRQQWFAYKENRYIENVKTQIEAYDNP